MSLSDDGSNDTLKDIDSTLLQSFPWVAQLDDSDRMSTGNFTSSFPGIGHYQDLTACSEQLSPMLSEDAGAYLGLPTSMSQGDSSVASAPSSVPSLDSGGTMTGSEFSSPDILGLADQLTSPFFTTEPQAGAYQSGFSTGSCSPMATPKYQSSARSLCFQSLLVSCSEVEQLLKSIQTAEPHTSNFDTCAPSEGLQRAMQAMDLAAECVLASATPSLSKPPNRSMSVNLPVQHAQGFTGGSLDSIDPSVLTRPSGEHADRTQRPRGRNEDGASDDLALHALALATSLRILDVCDAFLDPRPRDPASHTRVLFLKRLDLSLCRVRGALDQLACGRDLCRDTFTHKARHRALEVQARVKVSIGEAGQGSAFW